MYTVLNQDDHQKNSAIEKIEMMYSEHKRSKKCLKDSDEGKNEDKSELIKVPKCLKLE